jgi:ABC-type transport system substrate-binding protein
LIWLKRLRYLCLAVMLLAASWPATETHADDGGAITIGVLEPITNIDPAAAGDTFTVELLTHLYTGLVRQKENSLEVELALAASHTISDDKMVHTFTLVEGATFDDGTAITAQIFADSINRMITLAHPATAGLRRYVKSVAVDESGALQITFIDDYPFALQLLALPAFFPVNPAFFPADALAEKAFKASTNGIYRLVDFSFQGFTLVASSTWKGTPPATKTLNFKVFREPSDLRDALINNQLDMAWRGLSFDDSRLVMAGNNAVQATQAPSLEMFYLVMPPTKEPWDKVEARRPLSAFLDRERLVRDGLGGYGIPSQRLVPSQLGLVDVPTFANFDREAGMAALNEAGYSQYRTITDSIQTMGQIYGDAYESAVKVLADLLSLNAVYRLPRADFTPNSFFDQLEQATLGAAVIGWRPLFGHPTAYLEMMVEGPLANGLNYNDPESRALLKGKRYDALIARLTEQSFIIPVWQSAQRILFGPAVDGQSILMEANFLLRYDRLKRKP